MDEALLVKMVWLFLPLLLSHVSAESFSVVVPETTVSGQLGGSVTLPCALSDNLDVRKLEVRWYRPSMYSSPALLYLNEKLDLSVADIKYQGRVSLPGPLEKGEVSLKLDDLRPSDIGIYMCHVSSDRWYDKNNVSLRMQAVGSSPILSMLDAGGGKVNVSCQSHGWLPKPSLTWRDSDGSSLNPPNKHTSIKVSEGLFSVSSWRLFTSSESSWVSCSVALPDSVGVIRESRVMPHLPTDNGIWMIAFFGTLILLLLLIIGVGVYCVVPKKSVFYLSLKLNMDMDSGRSIIYLK
ncbi:butyrophilin subfamily 1 member A1-like [Astyanax mexicanus]|uniref:butyrophilin subfamily 1 member A1-like n=1 Tax=Astyanax mexicanus TaxID=7994 RepID=UPI0020CB0678|nr:butyrophilin subfamily 1 member A1-like [Astyanax mexicanus]